MPSFAPASPAFSLQPCARCGLPYDWRKSGSWSLKMTYCSVLCERGDLGFTLETFFRGTVIERYAWRSLSTPDLSPPEPTYHLLLA